MKQNPEFIQLLTSHDICTQDECTELLQKHKNDAFNVLLQFERGHSRNGSIDKAQLGTLWADTLGVAYVDLNTTLIQHHLNGLPEALARKHHVVLLYEFGDVITAATSDPSDQLVRRDITRLVGKRVNFVFAFPSELDDAIEVHYASTISLQHLMNQVAVSTDLQTSGDQSSDTINNIAGTQAVVELVRGILVLAVRERASDIHIEPYEDMSLVRFRIDGILHERFRLESATHLPLISRLKILANVDITEHRKPQDGRLSFSLASRSLDARFSVVPTIFGEKVVLRILGQLQKQMIPDLTELNLASGNYTNLRRLISIPNGILFVTGPTGSGKTTTIFSALKTLNTPGINIMTIEDPVEYRLPFINQVQANPAVGLDFATALRSFLRQDPDIILVGEIRDRETGRIASQAALTGHLVLASLHTNSALQAITRLMEIGVEATLISPSMIGVLCQRLVRTICDHCKEGYQLSKDAIEDLFVWDGKREVVFYRGRGCDQCHGTGYMGRIAIHELLTVTPELRTMIAREVPILDIQKYVMSNGFQALRYDGLKKVLCGMTTLDEVMRVAVEE